MLAAFDCKARFGSAQRAKYYCQHCAERGVPQSTTLLAAALHAVSMLVACRFIKNGFATYWENGNVEAALVPHPTLTASSSAVA